MWVHPPTQTFWPPKGLWPWISCVKLPLPRNSWIATIPLVLLLNSMNHSLVELPALLVHNWVSLFWSHTSISYDAYISYGISFILLRKIFYFKQIVLFSLIFLKDEKGQLLFGALKLSKPAVVKQGKSRSGYLSFWLCISWQFFYEFKHKSGHVDF